MVCVLVNLLLYTVHYKVIPAILITPEGHPVRPRVRLAAVLADHTVKLSSSKSSTVCVRYTTVKKRTKSVSVDTKKKNFSLLKFPKKNSYNFKLVVWLDCIGRSFLPQTIKKTQHSSIERKLTNLSRQRHWKHKN